MKLKLQFIIAAFIALVIYIPVAHGQANLTFSGGNGTPITITLQNSVSYTTTSNCQSGPFFVFDEAGNPFNGGSIIGSGTASFSVNAGTAEPIIRAASGSAGVQVTVNDILLYGNQPGVPNGSTVILNAGTYTTADNFAGAPPANGSFATFLAGISGGAFVRCSSNGVAVPTAATVSVSGRVITPQGRGIRNVVITMTNSQGNIRTATTTSFGYYRFGDVEAGEMYIFAARGKRFSFGQNSQVHSIMEDTNNINFIANDQSVLPLN